MAHSVQEEPSLDLKVGDYVTFNNVKFGAFLSAEGILLDDLVVAEDGMFDDCIFCIHLQRQYSALRELSEFLATNEIDPKKIDDVNLLKYYKALVRGRDNETKLNDSYLKKKMGQQVVFGDIIQLFHVKSGKYLQVIPDQLAKTERENIRVQLNARGDSYSWIQLMPRYKIDREGDEITSGSEMYFKVAERSNEYIHACDRDLPPGYPREINCSLESSSWRMTIFQSSLASADKSIILYSELVYLHDPETRSNIVVSPKRIESFDESDDAENKGNEGVNEDDVKVDVEGVEDGLIHSNVRLEMITGGGTDVSSGSLWFIESKTLVQGGVIHWKTEQVRFKHLNTGLYLALMHTTLPDGSQQSVLTSTDDSNASGTLFSLAEINSTTKLLRNSKALQVHHNECWLERGHSDENGKGFFVVASKDKNVALSLLISRYSQDTSEKDNADAAAKVSEPLDVFVGVAARNYLRKYNSMIVIPETDTVTTVWPSADREDWEFFDMVIQKAINFSQGFSIGADNVNLLVDKGDVVAMNKRKDLYSEEGLLEVLLQMIHALKPITDKIEAVQLQGKGAMEKLSDEQQSLLRMGSDILKRCFSLLYYCVKDHPLNQMYVADYMPVLLAHLAGQPLAGDCVTEMLSKNMELQETKIGTREISIFVDKLRASKMNKMYLQLLQSCCSCEGNGVDGNQCKVTKLLFANTNDIIISMHADMAKITPAEWKTGVYIPEGGIEEGSSMRGEVLFTKGLPRLSLSWTTNSIDFSPLGLFGKLSVNVEDLYKHSIGSSHGGGGGPNSSDSEITKKLKAKKSASAEQKAAVARYFVSQIYLCAEMCMDRNYVAMHKIDEFFTFETLVTVLKLPVIDDIKGAAARLLLCLHIDRDPQAETKVPCLTRAWSDIAKNPTPVLPCVEPQRRNMFCLVQQISSDYIQDMFGKRWKPSGSKFLRLVRAMANFNFYGTQDRMKDLIKDMLGVADRRLVPPPVDDKPSSSSSSSNKKKSSSSDKGEEKKIERYGVQEDDENATADNTMEEGGDTGAGGGDDTAKEAGREWQEVVLEFMESLPTMLFVLSVVMVAVGLTIYQVVADAPEGPGTALYIWTIAALVFFLLEIFIRGYCAIYVRKSFKLFFTNTFNLIDIAVISIDVIFLSLPPTPHSSKSNGSGKIAKVLRLIRLIRLLRLLRAARVMNAIVNTDEESSLDWIMPLRYSKVPTHEIDTIIECVEILLYCQKAIDDRNLSLLLRGFYLWESGEDTKTPVEIFQQVITDSEELSLAPHGSREFDSIFIDNLMFVCNPLVQGSLDILMAYHTMRKSLLNNAMKCQLLVSVKRERQYKLVDSMLQQLERNAETHELWGELESDADEAVNKQTKDILLELIDICRVRRTVLEFDEEFKADFEIQNLYRNLGCFTIAFKVLDLADSIEEDEETGELGRVALNTQQLCHLANELLYWFCLDNPENQYLAYDELEFFTDSLDDEIGSHNVIRSIFRNNEKLMTSVPHSLLGDLADKICGEGGHKLEYLTIFLSITNVGEKNIPDNQTAIMASLMSPGRLKKVACFLVPVTHPDYEYKRQLMAPFLNGEAKIQKIDDLPGELGYHLMLVDVMAGCTVGRINITSIEAKVQSVFNYIDVTNSILDPGTILFAKIRLGRFILNAVIEVEISIPGIEYTACLWKLFESFIPAFKAAKEELLIVQKKGWEYCTDRGIVEYAIVGIKILGAFFGRYFDIKAFRTDDNEGDDTKVQLKPPEVRALLSALFSAIKELYQLKCPNLSDEQHNSFFEVMGILNNCTEPKLVDNMAALESKLEKASAEEEMTQEVKVLSKYKEFLDILLNDESIQKDAEDENKSFVEALEALPYLSDPVESDLRYEGLITKVVAHIRENMIPFNNEIRMEPRVTKTAIWIVKAFRTMIENKMGMSIYERDDDGGEEQDIAAAPVVQALNHCGATALVLDLIAVGIDPELQAECLKLGVGLLFKEGGALEVQGLMHNHLRKTNSYLFFKQIRLTLQKLIAWHDWNEVIILEEGKDPDIPADIIVVRFLQLMCEGHYLPNQDLLREQRWNSQSFNLLDDLVNYLNCLTRYPCRTSTCAGIRVGATILEVIQGPCVGNQEHFALNTELLEGLNRLLRSKVVNDCVPEDELELKKIGIDIEQGLLEGQNPKGVISERVCSVVHIDVIEVLAGKSEEDAAPIIQFDANGDEIVPPPLSDDEVELQTESMVLLKMISNKVIDFSESSGTGSIEVIWRGSIQKRFFHIPDICSDLAKSSKDKLVQQVVRTTPELKLIDFVNRCRGLYREVKHQQVLKNMRVGLFFNPQMQNRLTWLSFGLALVINILLLIYYDNSTGVQILPPDITNVVDGLITFQICLAAIIVTVNLVVRSPVILQTMESQSDIDSSSFSTKAWLYFNAFFLDGMTFYYWGYFAFCICGKYVENYLFLPLLLLDLVMKNSTAMDVVNAIVIPRKELALVCIICVFVVHLYTHFIFHYFRDEFYSFNYKTPLYTDCTTFFSCFTSALRYGLSQPGGIGDELNHTVGDRFLLDLTFFLVVIIGVLNLIFGIIIMTFSTLREAAKEREENTTETCFICSIEKEEFDRNGGGFKPHIKNDHFMWNYLYFMIFLWEQDRDDDDGLEQYIRRNIENNKVLWFPMGKASCLDQEASFEEELRLDLEKSVSAAEGVLNSRIHTLQADVTVVLEQLTQKIKSDVDEGGSQGLTFGGMGPGDSRRSTAGSRRDPLILSNTIKPKKVSVQILCVTGDICRHFGGLECTVLNEEGGACGTSVGRVNREGTVISFDATTILLSERVRVNDARTISFSFTKMKPPGGGSINSLGSAVNEEVVAECKGVHLREVFLADGLSLDKTFWYRRDNHDPVSCTLLIQAHCAEI